MTEQTPDEVISTVMRRDIPIFDSRERNRHTVNILHALTTAGYAIEPGWQPIESAPKTPLNMFSEGPTILLFGGFISEGVPCVRTGCWKAARTNAWIDTALGRCARTPTHWRSLPGPPKGDPT